MKSFFRVLDPLLVIRFLAALFVIRQHTGFNNPKLPGFLSEYSWLVAGDINAGGRAVAVFFVISAYLMSKIWLSGKYTISFSGIYSFFLSRISRIVPLFWLVCGLSIFLYFPYLIEPGNKLYLRTLRIFLFLDNGDKFNQVIWSVNVEMFFYLLTPILASIFLLMRKTAPILNHLFSLLVFFSSLYFLLKPEIYNQSLFVITTSNLLHGSWFDNGALELICFLPVFMAGFGFYALIASVKALFLELKSSQLSLVKKVPNPIKSFIKNLEGFGSVSKISILLPVLFIMAPLTSNFTLVVATLFFIFIVDIASGGGLKVQNQSAGQKFGRLLNHFGHLSYGIYLFHMLILIRINDIYSSYLMTTFGNFRSGIITFFIVSTLSIIITNFFYWAFEVPARKWILKTFAIKS